jgi:D-sedoheptulose 7-phosphate isomerase
MTSSDYSKYLICVLEENNLNLEEIVQKVLACIERGSSIWIMGNGGSASTAEHFETDLSFVRLGNSIPTLKVSSLSANSALITAIANDIGFEFVFSHQILRKAAAGDLLIAISASGNSENLIRAIQVAKQLDLVTIALLGFDGGRLAGLVDVSAIVTTEIGKYGPVEDIHLSLCHEISARVSQALTQ